MSREIFEERHSPDWTRLEAQLRELETGKRTATENFPLLYRRVCHHLALARHRLYGHDLERRLNALVQRSHELLYGPLQPRAGQIYELLTGEFPRALRREEPHRPHAAAKTAESHHGDALCGHWAVSATSECTLSM